ncbi:MAG: hydrogenase maturation nickel metallochaperone HypA [Candidatus Omnitrophota bacterium]
MHDITFAHEIIAALRREKRFKNGGKVVVNVRLSPLGHVTPESLCNAFSAAADAAKITGVKLAVKTLEFPVTCRACGHTFTSARPVFTCSSCAGNDLDIEHGREFFVESIEIRG